ncbi:triosephosphate isomerase [Methylopila jiangsuensis]|uniref:Triosephosphate isomerase n=1 Tax=Methylopila jiangsuensis TaxID=586230 RepID=A0A9W6JG69_9HYPH|nr:triose-phosphate isomerase [Methylopila jiangsuensis]MDR6286058.1 triosephosphate isomerase [Methylopila jiangsuensis]GLK75816.1 triosephosphate isomerase [Methylopila jiangsuensis]
MTVARKPLVAGNWKMHGLASSAPEFVQMVGAYPAIKDKVDLMVFPPATLLTSFATATRGAGVIVGAQDCHPEASGAFTGDISAEMVRDAGGGAVIVGHSERRSDHRETDQLIRAKAKAALRASLVGVVCVGETEDERKGGQALAVVGRQLAGSLPDESSPETIVVAYEPVWAIGTGLTPTVDEVAEMHRFIRDELARRFGDAGRAFRVLYGGSVKPGNAVELLAVEDVDGALVGGASLKADSFLAIARAAFA